MTTKPIKLAGLTKKQRAIAIQLNEAQAMLTEKGFSDFLKKIAPMSSQSFERGQTVNVMAFEKE